MTFIEAFAFFTSAPSISDAGLWQFSSVMASDQANKPIYSSSSSGLMQRLARAD